jgi:hypothetical protein
VREFLRPLLAAYRQQIEPAWSDRTSHPDFPGALGSPTGQCGVTSAWLQQRLRDDHGIDTTYYVGQVWLYSALLERDHCWLQVDDIVIDITASQLGLNETVCGYWRDLIPVYLGRPGEPPWGRLRVLEEAL